VTAAAAAMTTTTAVTWAATAVMVMGKVRMMAMVQCWCQRQWWQDNRGDSSGNGNGGINGADGEEIGMIWMQYSKGENWKQN
jgi:hypothetical protein